MKIKHRNLQMLADPLLTEHYAKAGLKAVLIDQQHGLYLSFITLQVGALYILMARSLCASGILGRA